MNIQLILFLIVIWNVSAIEWYLKGDPHFLTSQNIQNAMINPSQIKIIKFFTPWCRYCRYLKPIIDNFHQKIIKQGRKDIKFYQINCQDQSTICQKLGIDNYPQVKIIDFKGQISGQLSGYYPQQQTNQILQEYISLIDSNNKPKPIIKQLENKQPIQQKIVRKQIQIPQNKLQVQQKKQIIKTQVKKQEILPKQQNVQKQVKKQLNDSLKKQNNQQKINTKEKTINIDLKLTDATKILIYILIGLIGGYYLKDIIAESLPNKKEQNQKNNQLTVEDMITV